YPPKELPEQVVVRLKGRKDYRLEKQYDAVFWTESSIEKFLLPYYQAHRLLTDEQMMTLQRACADPDVAAIAHLPWTQDDLLKGVDGTKAYMVLERTSDKDEEGPALKETSLEDFLASRPAGVP